jgi:hypothetical protein
VVLHQLVNIVSCIRKSHIINRLKLLKAVVEREIVDYDETGYSLTDPLFEIWFKRTMM